VLTRTIGDVHLHTVLMLAAVALIWLFVLIVVAVTWLQRRGRLGQIDRQVSFQAYGPVLAAACSGGAAAVHLTVIGEHALRTGAGSSASAVAFLCSIGAGSAHFATADASIAGFLPLGIVSLVTVGLQSALAVPRAWRNRLLAIVGLAVTLISVAVSVAPRVFGVPQVDGAVAVPSIGYSDALAFIFEVILVALIAMLVLGRPRGLLDRLRVKVADAYVGTGLGIGAVVIFTIAAVVAGHAAH
jgi:hypothetical protein